MSSKNLNLLAGACALAIPLVGSQWASASVLLFNFGGVAVSAALTTDSPGHASGAWTGTSATWNTVATSDINVNGAGGTLYDYAGHVVGSGGTGVGLDLAGNSTSPYATLTFGNTTNNPTQAANHGNGAGDFAAGSPASGNTYDSVTAVTSVTGADVTGLAYGTYAVFVTSYNDYNLSATLPENIYINATNATGSYTLPGSGSALVDANTGNSQASWINGTNYVMADVTVSAASPVITVASQATSGSTEDRGFLNSIEVVPVSTPEPAVVGLLAPALGLMLRRQRRAGFVVRAQ